MKASNSAVVLRVYLFIWGSLLIVLGVGSLIIHPDFAVGDHVTARPLFGVLETNGWHGLAGGSLGVLAVYSAYTRRWMTVVGLVVAVVGGIVAAVIFLVSGDESSALGLIPVDAIDAFTLHLLPGVVGLACLTASRVRGSGEPPAPTRVDG